MTEREQNLEEFDKEMSVDIPQLPSEIQELYNSPSSGELPPLPESDLSDENSHPNISKRSKLSSGSGRQRISELQDEILLRDNLDRSKQHSSAMPQEDPYQSSNSTYFERKLK
mmetsp:Transcript_6245/g.5367  ORF Transcript_6245/g.5367 Transcript_6245/m.5367 type:complete len:113 (+) Transcript_6245:241-579(+)